MANNKFQTNLQITIRAPVYRQGWAGPVILLFGTNRSES
jgi:hypothetical protein